MSLIEASIILSVISILAAILAPGVNGYIDQSRRARAQGDLEAIGTALQTFIDDNGEHQFLNVAKGFFAEEPPDRSDDATRVDLLVSDGDIPPYQTALGATESFWTQAVDLSKIDTLVNHLVTNSPATAEGATPDAPYRTPTDMTVNHTSTTSDFLRLESSGFNGAYSWRGAYLRGPVGPDPWGNRYAVNVAFLDPAPTDPIASITAAFNADEAPYPRLDVFVLTAGPDEEIDTPSAQDGAVPGDDDLIFMVSANAK